MTVLVDFTHCHRKTTGIERISLELFSKEALAPLATQHVTAASVPGMIARQWLDMPAWALRHPRSVVLCPGFPPSIALQAVCSRIITYVHDLFLITQVETLNRNARYYLRPSFKAMLRTQRLYLTNSETTRQALRKVARPEARIELYRPVIRDIFGLAGGRRERQPGAPFTFVALGTVEPRKNYPYAAEIVEALNARGFACRLKIIGRNGWGADAQALAGKPGVELLGHLGEAEIRAVVGEADAILCTSIDEGLGLPLVELQYSGLPTFAVDIPVFREVMSGLATFIPRADAAAAADEIAADATDPAFIAAGEATAARILSAYNTNAGHDRDLVLEIVSQVERSSSFGATVRDRKRSSAGAVRQD